jgi:hypothetical protein
MNSYEKKLERSREWKKTPAGIISGRKSSVKYNTSEEAKEKKRIYYLKKKEERIQKTFEETGEYPPMRGRGRPRKISK